MDKLNRKQIEPEVCSREKYWSELNADEKIERMREQVKMKTYQVENLLSRIGKMEFVMLNHSHIDDKVVIPANAEIEKPMQSQRSFLGRLDNNDKEVYF